MRTYTVPELTDFAREAFQANGMREQDATQLARSLVIADATGVGTHGLTRLRPYLAQLASGQVNAAPRERVLSESPSAVLVDADRGFGVPVGIRTLDRLMTKATETGIAFGGVTRVAHFGAAGYFTRYAARHGFLAIAMSSTSPSVVPFGGRGPRLGNSPMSFAAPGIEEPELVMDMAQSVSSRGRIKLFQAQGRELPEGWAVDSEGIPTTDPSAALAGGVLASGGHKGTALSLMVEMLASGMTGAHLSKDIRHAGFTSAGLPDLTADVTVGNAYLVLNTAVFGTGAAVRGRATEIAEHVRASAPARGIDRVLAPGDPERERLAHAHEHGVPIEQDTVREFAAIAGELGLNMPNPINDDQAGTHGHRSAETRH
ncbi:Ldh family oxidoreductase [Sciscionella sediminilitoris]|uniref:Ldh family oxidoreductase n=1 Tax=Sciscionella sediminilitoris TaxID=1445613 RepID=UPI00068C5EDF|nr:Ldh family oxidoreductase [Sciscionella sp. SE31]